jgi:hypothetical protein
MKTESDKTKSEPESMCPQDELCVSDDDLFTFVPVEHIRTLERVIDNLLDAKQRLSKMY